MLITKRNVEKLTASNNKTENWAKFENPYHGY